MPTRGAGRLCARMGIAMRMRVKFEKRDSLRFTSHRDVMRMIQRAIAAAGVPIAFSSGYHPHMRMSFGAPLKTGWEGLDEYVDLHFDGPADSLAERCNAFLPDGLRFLACTEVASGAPKLANDICAADYWVRLPAAELASDYELDDGSLARRSEGVLSDLGGPAAPDQSRPRVVSVSALSREGDLLVDYTTEMRSGRVVSPEDVLHRFDLPADLPTPPRVARKVQYVCRNGEYLSPLSETVIQGIT